MVVGTLEIELRLDGCFSLKDKRSVLRSLLDRARSDFGLSAAEVGDQDLWNSAVIGLAAISNDAAHAESILSKALNLFERHADVEVVGASWNIQRT